MAQTFYQHLIPQNPFRLCKHSLENKKEKIKTKLSFKEKREWEELPKEIAALETRRDELNAVFESSHQEPSKVEAAAEEIKIVLKALDDKEMRWLELSEFDYE